MNPLLQRGGLTLVLLAVAGLWAPPARAAGVGFSLPKLRELSIGDAHSWGGSVQVVGGDFSVGPTRIDLLLDYAYTRDFGAAANYSFFDAVAGVGLPLSLSPVFFVTPALDAHILAFAASPQLLGSPAFGIAPRVTLGYKPAAKISIELSLGYTFLPALSTPQGTVSGGMSTVELGGTYSF